MRRLARALEYKIALLSLLFAMLGCPNTVPPLLASLPLDHAPSLTSLSMAVDSERQRAYVADGQRIKTIDLATLKYVEPGSAKGAFYGIDDEDDLVAVISPENGQVRQILTYDTPLAAEFATGMAYNPDAGTAFVLDIASPGGAVILYEMNMRDASLTQIGPTGLGIDVMRALCLARDPQGGSLYTITPEDYLFRINPQSGLASVVGYVGSDFDNIQELAVSAAGALYGIHSGNPSKLVLLDKSTGAGTLAAELPLSYTFGSLAFKPDGTLWGVDLSRNALVQIDIENGSILTEFETLVMNLPFKPDPAFEGIDSLTYFPSEPASGRIYEADPANDIDALALCGNDGALLAASINYLHHFDNTLGLTRAPARPPTPAFELGPQFLHLVYNPANGFVYGRDQLKGLVYEINPSSLEVVRQIRYVEASSNTFLTYSTPLAIDPDTARLFVQHDQGDLFVVDLVTGEIQDLEYELPVDGVIVDSSRRRLYVATQGIAPGAYLDKLDLDTLERLDRTLVEHKISMTAFDPVRNRMAVNAQIGTTSRSSVFLYDLETLSKIPFSLSLNSLDARMVLDPATNYLILVTVETPRQVRIYGLPD